MLYSSGCLSIYLSDCPYGSDGVYKQTCAPTDTPIQQLLLHRERALEASFGPVEDLLLLKRISQSFHQWPSKAILIIEKIDDKFVA